MEKSVEVRVTGRVQGVWYRAWTEETARGHGLSGWVRNEADGSVRALLSGDAEAVDRMIEAMRRGPPNARVAGLDVAPAEAAAGPGFDVRR